MDKMREDFEAWYNQEYEKKDTIYWFDETGFYSTPVKAFKEELFLAWEKAYKPNESPESLALRRVIVLLGIVALFFAATHFPKVKEGFIWALSFLPF